MIVLHRALPVCVETAIKAEEAGVDALIAVGSEGGGHIGERIPTTVLIPQVVKALQIPVVGGGGIVDGKGMVAVMALGADGVYMGTRFIATTECPAHQNFKNAIIAANDLSTVTCTGPNRILRALKTPLLERALALETDGGIPLERALIYASGFRQGMIDGDIDTEGTLPCGAGAGMITEIKSASDVVRDVVREADEVISMLAGNKV